MASYFFDTSALVKIYHREAGSDYVERITSQSGSRVFISRLSLVEMESVFAIKVRTGELDAVGRSIGRRRFHADVAQGRLFVGPPTEEKHFRSARELRMRFAVSHALRTLDALQLAVVLELHGVNVVSALVSADQRMCRVAEVCGCGAIDPANPGLAVS